MSDSYSEQDFTLEDALSMVKPKWNPDPVITYKQTWEIEDEKKQIEKQKKIQKNKLKPKKDKPKLNINFHNDIKNIDEKIIKDYKYFEINIEISYQGLKRQENHLDLNDMSIDKMLDLYTIYDTIYDKEIYITNEIYENYDLLNDDIDKYELILFINSIKGFCKNIEELFDEDGMPIKKRIIKYYKEVFSPYFKKLYKNNFLISNDTMRNIKSFNYHYDKIYPNEYKKQDNPKEYNRLVKNKSNLKTQYRKYLEGADINELNNIPALKMMIYIIDTIEAA